MPAYAFTIALSALLLFLVQPIIARQILPWFGGSAAVWTTCMMFFQTALLAGYAYSDWTVRRLGPLGQRKVHAALLLASLAFLPIVLSDAWRPSLQGAPVLQIVWLLTATIGLPYFMLSTTGPLLQAWFARRYPGARVYRLYALSNAASMAALIAYPPLIEPSASVPVQALGWSMGYVVFVAAGLLLIWRAPGVQGGAEATSPVSDSHSAPPSGRTQITWFGYSALGSVLLLSVTAHLTQNVASVPFLWLLPLVLYLLSFILCFDGHGWYRPRLFRGLAGIFALLMAVGLVAHLGAGWQIEFGSMPLVQGLVLYATGLFVLCMFLHGELAERRPAPAFLTRFYLMLALGGAAGGVFVAVVAGLIFNAYVELPIALVVCSFIVLFSVKTERARFVAMLGCVASIVFTALVQYGMVSGAVASSRNFYGVLKVSEADAASPENARLRLSHGNTLHGEQFLDPSRRALPTSYYGKSSGVGLTVNWLQTHVEGPHKVGVVGLGAGTLATYGRSGDRYRFYEIDPAVAVLAERHFSFLRDSAASTEVLIGDGRLLLEREPPNGYELLVVDAFSSDSIPMHLLTIEAMREYARHVKPQGAVAINISNRYLDLRPVVRHLADAVGWKVVGVHDQPPSGAERRLASQWVVLTRNQRLLNALSEQDAIEPLLAPKIEPWTDAYGNLFDVVRVWQ